MGPGRENVIQKEWIFDPSIEDGYPENFKQVLGLPKNADMKNPENLKVGVTSYENFWTQKEMD